MQGYLVVSSMDAEGEMPAVELTTIFLQGMIMREETKQSLQELVFVARASGDANAMEAARVVERDLLNGGRNTYVPVVIPDVTNNANAAVTWEPKKKPRKR